LSRSRAARQNSPNEQYGVRQVFGFVDELTKIPLLSFSDCLCKGLFLV
jgi:hypothetical protein